MKWDQDKLRELTKQVAEHPVPSLDWDRVEERLFESIEEPPPRSSRLYPLPERRGSSGWRVLSLAAVASAMAAAVALFAVGNRGSDSQRERFVQQPVRAAGKGAPLHSVPADLPHPLVAGDRAQSMEFAQGAEITALPHSTVRIAAVHPSIRLVLERGAVHVRVPPDHGREVLSVRAGRTVVSVHGTEFTVTRTTNHIVVDVQHGTVAVGEAGRKGMAQRWLIHGPSKGQFSLDGAKEAHFDPAPVVANTGTAQPQVADAPQPSQPRATSAGKTPSDSSSAAHHPPSDDQVLAGLRQQITNCYQSLAPKPSQTGVSVRVHTSVRIIVAPDGHVRFARFMPPIHPKAQVCASDAVRTAAFAPATEERELHLQLSF